MKTTLFILFLATAWNSFAQHPTCNGSRYINPTYTVDATLGITFGNSTSYSGTNADLLLDFFEPSGDVAVNRPLIILAFGGSFIGGARTDMHDFCNYYAAHGYTCAAIDYRLYDGPLFPLPDSVTMTDEVLKAVSDMKAAVRFFREDAATTNTYKVDTNLIFVGGISAGAIVASHVGMLDSTDVIEAYIDPLISANGGWTGNSSTNTQYGDGVSGILNYSGALRKASYIDANDPPLFSVHDDGDDVVPYANGQATIFTIPIISLEGSSLMHQEAQSDGVNSELITIANSSGHVSYFGNQVSTDTILTRSLNFLYPIVCGSFASITEQTAAIDFKMYPNPSNSSVTIYIENPAEFGIQLYDVAGRVITSTETTAGKSTIFVDGLTPGAYFVQLSNESLGKSELKQLLVF